MGKLGFLFFFLLMLSFSFSQAQNQIVDLAKLKDIDGKAVSVAAKDEKVFLYFWAYWCPDCEEKFTDFFPKYMPKSKIPVFTVNTDSKENKVRGFIEKHKISSTVIMDNDKSLRQAARINGVPSWALLQKNKSGTYDIVQSKVGFDEDEVKKILGL